jgi:ATP:cob(I)alamin adenosyltransferase
MRIDRVYTRAGDDGRTSLGDGARVPKFHVRVAAYGALDEANAVIGVALLYIEDARAKDIRIHVQNDLFDLGADLSRPEREYRKAAPLRASERQVAWLEEAIDSLNASLCSARELRAPGRKPGRGAPASRPDGRPPRRALPDGDRLSGAGESHGAEIREPSLRPDVRSGPDTSTRKASATGSRGRACITSRSVTPELARLCALPRPSRLEEPREARRLEGLP